MKFPSIKIENFLAITEAHITLADRGLVAIQGRNHADSSADSNGAGKSTIADALCWCLFGTTARDVTGDEVINEKAGKNCRVELLVVDGALTYTIARHRKHKTGKNSLHLKVSDGLKETDLTKGTDKLTQVEVDKVIGSSLEVFAGSIYAGQERMPNLPAMTDKHLKLLIEEAAGVTTLEEAYKGAREVLGAAENALQHAITEQASLANRKLSLDADAVNVAFDIETWEKARAQRLSNAAAEVKDLVAKLKPMASAIQSYDAAGVVAKIAEIDARISGVQKEHAELARLAGEVATAQSAVAAAEGTIRQDAAEVERLKRDLGSVNSRIGQPCGECGRPITADEISGTQDALKHKIIGLKGKEAANSTTLVKAQEALKKAESDYAAYKAGMTDITTEQAERQGLERDLSAHNARITDHKVVMNDARAMKEKIEGIKVETNPHLSRQKQIAEELDKITKDILASADRVRLAEIDRDTEKEVARVFSPAGVRARILDEVTPFLNAQTSKYLSTMSDGNIVATWQTLTPAAKKGEFKEKFSIEVANATGGGSFKKLSGGEKRKVRISTALALQDLVATRASKPIDLFIGDEIDDALDASGLERLMIILEEKAKERGSVFVISHNELSDFIRQVLTIDKQANGDTKVTEMVS